MKIEIKNTKEEAINWSVPQLVITDDGDVAITTGRDEDVTFEAYHFNQEHFSKHWEKARFKKFNGEITLSND